MGKQATAYPFMPLFMKNEKKNKENDKNLICAASCIGVVDVCPGISICSNGRSGQTTN